MKLRELHEGEFDYDDLWENPTVEKIIAWTKTITANIKMELDEKHIKVHPDGRVDIKKNFIWVSDRPRLPFRLRRVQGHFIVHRGSVPLKTTDGFPETVTDFVRVTNHVFTTITDFPTTVKNSVELDRCLITSFAGITPRVSDLSVVYTAITSLKGIHQHLHELRQLTIGSAITSGLTSAMLIPKISSIFAMSLNNPKLGDAVSIFNRVVKDGYVGRVGVLELNQRLLDAGLEDFA